MDSNDVNMAEYRQRLNTVIFLGEQEGVFEVVLDTLFDVLFGTGAKTRVEALLGTMHVLHGHVYSLSLGMLSGPLGQLGAFLAWLLYGGWCLGVGFVQGVSLVRFCLRFQTRAPLTGVVLEGSAAFQLTTNHQGKGVFNYLGAGSWVLERLSTGAEAPQGALGLWCTPYGVGGPGTLLLRVLS